jgi:hypothetical protein
MFARYLANLKRFLAGNSQSNDDVKAILAHCSSDIASKEDRLFLLPKAKGLQAVAQGDQKSWEQSIAELLKAHEKEARQGELKLSFEAFICLPALMLVKLGMERQMKCTLDNPYLPVFLLAEAAK